MIHWDAVAVIIAALGILSGLVAHMFKTLMQNAVNNATNLLRSESAAMHKETVTCFDDIRDRLEAFAIRAEKHTVKIEVIGGAVEAISRRVENLETAKRVK